MRMGLLLVIALALVSACTKTTGDTKTKNFHITEIVLKEDLAKGCRYGCPRSSVRVLPEELRTKLTNALHHYAAAYNQLQTGAPSAYRLEVTLDQLSYEKCSVSKRVLNQVTGGLVDSGASTIVSTSKLIDVNTGSEIREFVNHNTKIQWTTCTKTSQNDGYSKQMSKYILRKANLLKKTPKSVEQILAGVDVLQPRLQPISSLSSLSVNPTLQ